MVPALDRKREIPSSTRPIPRLLELVGPAGAGKTTLAEILRTCAARIQVVNHPNPRALPDLPFFLRNAVVMLPTLAGLYRGSGGECIARREAAWMLILNGWDRKLRRNRVGAGPALVLDQGPVFLLTVLHQLGPACLSGPGAERWWRKVYRQWAAALDLIVYLDAADDVLLQRIRVRLKDHPVKTEEESTAFAFLDQFRSSYGEVLSGLRASGGRLPVLSLDSGRNSPEEMANAILAEIEPGRNGPVVDCAYGLAKREA